MERYYERLKRPSTRAALFASAFATSVTLLLAVGSAFYSLSNEPVLADSPHARLAAERCDALGHRDARQHCMRRLVVEANAHDAGAAKLVALAAGHRGVAGQ